MAGKTAILAVSQSPTIRQSPRMFLCGRVTFPAATESTKATGFARDILPDSDGRASSVMLRFRSAPTHGRHPAPWTVASDREQGRDCATFTMSGWSATGMWGLPRYARTAQANRARWTGAMSPTTRGGGVPSITPAFTVGATRLCNCAARTTPSRIKPHTCTSSRYAARRATTCVLSALSPHRIGRTTTRTRTSGTTTERMTGPIPLTRRTITRCAGVVTSPLIDEGATARRRRLGVVEV